MVGEESGMGLTHGVAIGRRACFKKGSWLAYISYSFLGGSSIL